MTTSQVQASERKTMFDGMKVELSERPELTGVVGSFVTILDDELAAIRQQHADELAQVGATRPVSFVSCAPLILPPSGPRLPPPHTLPRPMSPCADPFLGHCSHCCSPSTWGATRTVLLLNPMGALDFLRSARWKGEPSEMQNLTRLLENRR